VLQHRGPQLAVAVAVAEGADDGLEVLPRGAVGGEQIVHPLHAGDAAHRSTFPMGRPIRTFASFTRLASKRIRSFSKRRITVEPISKRPSSAPLLIRIGVSKCATWPGCPWWVMTSAKVTRIRLTQVAPTITRAIRPAGVDM